MTSIKAFGVLSVAKISGAIGVFGGLVLGVPFALIAYVSEGSLALSGSLVAALPIVYGASGFVGGAFFAWLYNLLASRVGAIEIDLAAR